RHDRHGRRRVFRRTLDQLVRIDHVDQHIAPDVAAAHDLHLLEEQRAALPKHIVALRKLFLDADWTHLPACQRAIRDLFGYPEPPRESTLLRNGEMTGHAVDAGIVEPIGRKLVIRAEQLEYGGTATDQIRLVGGMSRADR